MFEYVVRLAELSDIVATEESLKNAKDRVSLYYSFNWAFFHEVSTILRLANEVRKDFPNKLFSQMDVDFTTIRDGEALATVTLLKTDVSVDEFIKLRRRHLIHSIH